MQVLIDTDFSISTIVGKIVLNPQLAFIGFFYFLILGTFPIILFFLI